MKKHAADSGATYGVTRSSNKLQDFAWGGETGGWIKFCNEPGYCVTIDDSNFTVVNTTPTAFPYTTTTADLSVTSSVNAEVRYSTSPTATFSTATPFTTTGATTHTTPVVVTEGQHYDYYIIAHDGIGLEKKITISFDVQVNNVVKPFGVSLTAGTIRITDVVSSRTTLQTRWQSGSGVTPSMLARFTVVSMEEDTNKDGVGDVDQPAAFRAYFDGVQYSSASPPTVSIGGDKKFNVELRDARNGQYIVELRADAICDSGVYVCPPAQTINVTVVVGRQDPTHKEN